MSIPPPHQFRSDEYDRPNQAWTCGGEAQGLPCPLGPTQLGVCQAECTPRKEGDRYFCNHASQLAGSCDEGPLPDGVCCQMPPQCEPSKKAGLWVCNRGMCQSGPLPDGSCSQKFASCHPIRGVMALRRLTVITVLGLAIGSLLLMSGVPNRSALVSPGALASHHQGVQGCQDCHSGIEGQLVDWVHTAFSSSPGPNQTQLCLKCHTELGENATLAHSLAPEVLTELANNTDPTSSSGSLILQAAQTVSQGKHQHLACMTCHREHQGEEFDMTQMANRECQVCHSQTFDSFHQGHPELTDFFYQRRTRLHFNHASHAIVHYSNFKRTVPNQSMNSTVAQGDFNCVDCHVSDSTGQSMLTLGFESSCASCHEHQIVDDEILPIEILHIPLSQIGDGELAGSPKKSPPVSFMQMLLLDKPENDVVTSQLSSSQNAEPSEHAVQQLLAMMLHQDHEGMEQRMRESFGADAAAVDLSRLAKTLTQLDLRRIDRQYLLALIAGELEKIDDTSNTDNHEQAASIDSSPWNLARSPGSLTLSYRPIGHGDPFLIAWLEAGARCTDASKFLSLSDTDSPLTTVFRRLTDPTLAGRCLKCHTVEKADDGHLQIEWSAKQASIGGRKFTQFSHSPHLILGEKLNCTTCHPIAPESEVVFFKPEFLHQCNTININALSTETSGLQPVEKATCSKCHQYETSGDNCLQCHLYHIDSH